MIQRIQLLERAILRSKHLFGIFSLFSFLFINDEQLLFSNIRTQLVEYQPLPDDTDFHSYPNEFISEQNITETDVPYAGELIVPDQTDADQILLDNEYVIITHDNEPMTTENVQQMIIGSGFDVNFSTGAIAEPDNSKE